MTTGQLVKNNNSDGIFNPGWANLVQFTLIWCNNNATFAPKLIIIQVSFV